MKRSQRLQVLVDLKANEEKKHLENLAQEQLKRSQKEAQLLSLKAYRDDYLQNNATKMQDGISVMRLIEFRAFMDKLDEAIAGEERSLQEVNRQIECIQKDWEAAHFYTNNMQKIQTKALINENDIVEKKEQLEMDEHAARKSSKSGVNRA